MKSHQNISFELSGLPLAEAPYLIVWGHGWGMDNRAFAPFTETLANRAAHLRLDFPGFGNSAPPPENWTTADYADAVATLLGQYRTARKIIWVGHSFGGRVGIQLAARRPELIDGLFLISGAGLQRHRSFYETLHMKTRIYTFKFLKSLAPVLGLDVEALRSKFGSADYRNAGAMRSVFLSVIREDLSEQARRIQCPVQLVYGENDRETPPEIGVRLKALIPNASLAVLPNQDHYTVLGDGRHAIIKRLTDFIGSLR